MEVADRTLTDAWANSMFGLMAKAVIAHAVQQNGWDVQKYWRAPITEGTVPSGFILAERRGFNASGQYLTAEFTVQESGDILFQEGHYNLYYQDAIVDYVGRCERRVGV